MHLITSVNTNGLIILRKSCIQQWQSSLPKKKSLDQFYSKKMLRF